jgi:adenosylhomocysteine nucleosidase
MKPTPLIVMALESEGQGKLERLGLEVVYCGVGKVNATYHLTRRLAGTSVRRKFSYVLNLGSAGSHSFNSGAVVAADRFVQRYKDVTGLGFAHGETPYENDPAIITFPRRFEHLPHGVCGSGDSFLQEQPPIPRVIIDMEAYALAKVCLRENVPFACVKYITDGADGAASRDWQSNLVHAARAFADLLGSSIPKSEQGLPTELRIKPGQFVRNYPVRYGT